MVKKKSVEICKFCKKDIICDKQKHTLIGTYDGKKIMQEDYFHFQCFVDWYNSKVKEKAQNIVSGMAGKMMPIARQLVGGVMGGNHG